MKRLFVLFTCSHLNPVADKGRYAPGESESYNDDVVIDVGKTFWDIQFSAIRETTITGLHSKPNASGQS